MGLIWDIYWDGVIFFLGICWGSFLNVCIYRIPAEKSVIHPRSSCPKCGYMIPWFDNIPLLSWLMLGAKCRQCKTAISPRYFLVELLTGFLFLEVWLAYPYNWFCVPYMLMVFGLILGTFVDIDHMWLPDRTTIGGMITGVVLSFIFPQMHGQTDNLQGMLHAMYAMAFGFGILWLVAQLGKLVFKKDAMGLGDVKLMGALGAYLGIYAVLFIIFISSLLGTIIGLSAIIGGRKEWQTRIPFGPYIAAAAIIWVLGGHTWWDWYMVWVRGPM